MTARRALVTGAGGFVGQWLCRELARQGWRVVGASLDGDPGPGILSPEDHALVAWHAADVSDRATVRAMLDAAAPDAIFHLAGMAFVPDATDDPRQAIQVNVGAAVSLLAEVRVLRAAGTIDPVVLLVGSAEQYGRHDHDAMPLAEEAECRPRNFYAATKMAQEVFGLEAFREDGTQVICTRSFNHSGRGQREAFLLPALVRRALDAKRTKAREITIGNTDTVRDFLHVEDVVRAYALLADQGFAGEVYNVCSGQGVAVEALAHEVLRAVGADAALAPDAALRRAVDVPFLVGRNDKLRADTGWLPQRSRADIIHDLIHAAS
ncbi:MAG: GDP-mannose 4,6-dehydratase [Gemmatimonadetes bacterium]|nr:GDP-mannose 4,6-dehydratase [Gemmatimonadota bacterium]MBI3566643.1 GDP-mannose 4,6-dehydratase [Gemmatimonadota bacterium]